MLAPAASVLAAGPSPIGQWELASGESRFSISYCGSGRELCARLTWLRDDARTDTNLKLLNREVVSHAVPRAENAWEGVAGEDDYGAPPENPPVPTAPNFGATREPQYSQFGP